MEDKKKFTFKVPIPSLKMQYELETVMFAYDAIWKGKTLDPVEVTDNFRNFGIELDKD